MQTVDVAIIGGTGIGERLMAMDGENVTIKTDLSEVVARRFEFGGAVMALFQRHSQGHKVPPHKVDYKSLTLAVKASGAKGCLASAAVGSLHLDWPPGTLASCTDFLDFTGRRLTFYDTEVRHTDFSVPFPLAPTIVAAAAATGIKVEDAATYVGCDGPRYETPAEIRMMQELGGDVVGMTASSEAILMREAGVPYGCLAVVTNLGCGLAGEKLDHGEVVDVMRSHGQAVVDVLLAAAKLVAV
ncbi:MAG: MTAP family purine nucleoside phosphorylase [Armatimonadetes bacterium]|nr:MTAP family purine nucleoside phosphorylase [Armatimonadota bacterium]